jgi:hypothetical protein
MVTSNEITISCPALPELAQNCYFITRTDHLLESTNNDVASNYLVLFILCLSSNPAKTVTNGMCNHYTLFEVNCKFVFSAPGRAAVWQTRVQFPSTLQPRHSRMNNLPRPIMIPSRTVQPEDEDCKYDYVSERKVQEEEGRERHQTKLSPSSVMAPI